ncbi:right-handed parallel beta-helix repeat-containing protein [Spirosoma fluviale]|uniref:Por secretion system C-terminal sorting domain-containing protein n=1 Tax=Spirosoma fluviale TaxID=1597977 RepID=A0A286GC84_9BACT|nr:right-handed parallel beta-helix repeat-containing protein [Spirosoma fluviale]SOD93122.1 Por secretion system C-terminal sorting domain-containing protein [Spirosoma fluviale]
MRVILTAILVVTSFYHTFAQSCDCDITISKAAMYDGKALGYKPGQTICIAAGNYPYLYFKNIVGSSGKPIKFINCDGRVTVGTSSGTNGIQFYDSKFVKLTGSGDSDYKYGIRLTKTPSGASGINVTGFSSDFEIERVEVSGTGFAGIMIKMDPTCNPATWRGNFSMYNIKVHDNYVHDTYGEGMYIGNSFWNSGITKNCDGESKVVYPHNIYGLAIYNNLVERTGAEGIQYGCAPDYRVYNNVVNYAGISPFATYQNNGIQASGGVAGRLYNNIVKNVSGNGIIILGHSGTNLIYNNLVTDIGGIGVFCDNRAGTPAGNSIIFTNNTIANTGKEGFALYNKLDRSTLANNAVIQSGVGKLLNTLPGVQVTQSANYYGASVSSALSDGVFDSSFNPLSGSPLVDKGITNNYWGVRTDLNGKGRPKGKGIDIGAYEFDPSPGARLGAEFSGIEVGVRQVLSFPSPCINEVFLQLTNSELAISEATIYTVDGKPVTTIKPATTTSELRVETASLPTGLYVFKVVTSELNVLEGRFIKQ